MYRWRSYMLDGVSLDQLRTFIAAADEGSFSAAGRRLRRAQSVVSQTLANLEGQLGVKLFDRSARYPVLTEQGRALLADARAVAGNMDLFKARAKSLAGGLEPDLSVVIDFMFPGKPFIAAVAAFQERFPATSLSLHVDTWTDVLEPVLDGRCALGVAGPLPIVPPQLTRERLLTVRVVTVVSPRHPLATRRPPTPTTVLAEHVQLLHTYISDISQARERGLLSPKVWRLGNLRAKHAFLLAGFGFGIVPLHMVEADLASGELVQLRVEEAPPDSHHLSVIYRTDSPPGPAGRWFMDRLKEEDAKWLQEKQPLPGAAMAKRQRLPGRSVSSNGRSRSATTNAKGQRSRSRSHPSRAK
jgi:DNA-binding transcriptional LysR family regulator